MNSAQILVDGNGGKGSRLLKIQGSHLVTHEVILPPGDEWRPEFSGWMLLQVQSGAGYCLERNLNQELPAGAVLMLSPGAEVNLRASQLGGMKFSFFLVLPELLTGLLTLGQQAFFEAAARRPELSQQIRAPGNPLSVKFETLLEHPNQGDFSVRLEMLGIFGQAFGRDLAERTTAEATVPVGARERLRDFLEQTLASDWLNLSSAELARKVNCTPRHLSRLFREITGMSFREKQAKIRLSRASELLAGTESKVVDVALDSGFQSLSLFSLMFRRRFGLSPGKWRKERRNPTRRISARRKPSFSFF